MVKVMAVLRTLFLIFVVGYTVRALPLFTTQAGTFDEQYARVSAALNLNVRAAWLAIAWIALETVIGWVMATRKKKLAPTAVPEPSSKTAAPPFAPPPR